MTARRLRRCQLSVPGANPAMLAKAAAIAVDYIFLDLEDAVAPSAKVFARTNVVEAVRKGGFKASTVAVRINDVSSQWFLDDVTALVEGCGTMLDVIILPKAKGPQDIVFVDRLLAMLEARSGLQRRIGLEVLVEEIEALNTVEAIAAASDRLEALIFGMGDYAASQGIVVSGVGETDDYPGDLYHYHRSRIAIAARAAGIVAVDGPYADFRNAEKYLEEARRAAIIGFVGKWAIHPAQIALAEAIFSPAEELITRARAMTEAYEAAHARGEGAISFEGKMVDIASIRAMRDVISRAEQIARRAD